MSEHGHNLIPHLGQRARASTYIIDYQCTILNFPSKDVSYYVQFARKQLIMGDLQSCFFFIIEVTEILEQPIITPSDILPESWQFVHLPYEDRIYRFGLPISDFEDINIWVHEFTEQSLNKILGEKNDPTLLFISGENGFFIDFSHILTSLCCTSSVKIDEQIIIVNSNEFYEFLKTKKLYKA